MNQANNMPIGGDLDIKLEKLCNLLEGSLVFIENRSKRIERLLTVGDETTEVLPFDSAPYFDRVTNALGDYKVLATIRGDAIQALEDWPMVSAHRISEFLAELDFVAYAARFNAEIKALKDVSRNVEKINMDDPVESSNPVEDEEHDAPEVTEKSPSISCQSTHSVSDEIDQVTSESADEVQSVSDHSVVSRVDDSPPDYDKLLELYPDIEMMVNLTEPSFEAFFEYDPLDLRLPPKKINQMLDIASRFSRYVEKLTPSQRIKYMARGSFERDYGPFTFLVTGSVFTGLTLAYPQSDPSDIDMVFTSKQMPGKKIISYGDVWIPTLHDMVNAVFITGICGGESRGHGHTVGFDRFNRGNNKGLPWMKGAYLGTWENELKHVEFRFDIVASTDGYKYSMFLKQLFEGHVEILRAALAIKYYVRVEKIYGMTKNHISATGYTTLLLVFLQREYGLPLYQNIKFNKTGQVENWDCASDFNTDYKMTAGLVWKFSKWLHEQEFDLVYSLHHEHPMTKEEFLADLKKSKYRSFASGYPLDNSMGVAWVIDPINWQNQAAKTTMNNIKVARARFLDLVERDCFPLPDKL